MECKFCLFDNSGEEERCRRCGKRLSGDSTFDGLSLAGATALAPRRKSSDLETGTDDGAPAPSRKAASAAVGNAGQQPSLFTGELSSNVIPFESYQRPGGSPAVRTEVPRSPAAEPGAKPPVTVKQPARKQSATRHSADGRGIANRLHRPSDSQGSLDLEFLQPAPQAPRTLKTTVEASIYCDAQVATPMHRSVAAILDAAMIVIGCGTFLGTFQLLGGGVPADRFDGIIFICAVLLITMFYGMLFALAGRETAGQNWTELRLINFDGMPPEGISRALRFAGCWLSFSCGIGLLWALLDEENLTWHDHMSKTFLTMREADSSFFRERPH